MRKAGEGRERRGDGGGAGEEAALVVGHVMTCAGDVEEIEMYRVRERLVCMRATWRIDWLYPRAVV